MSDLLLRGKVDMSKANATLSESVQQVKRYEDEIEAAASSTGRFTQTLQQQIREARNLLVRLAESGRANTEEYKKAQQQLAELTDKLQDIQETTRMMASDTASLDVANRSLNGLVTAMGALQSVTALTGSENQTLNNIMKGLKTTIAAVTAAITLANLAQKQFIATMMANPWGLVIAGIGAVIGALASLAGQASATEKAVADLLKTLNQPYIDAKQQKSMFDFMYNLANDTTRGWDERKRAVYWLNQNYPELQASIDETTKKLKLNSLAWMNVNRSIRANAQLKDAQTRLNKLMEIQNEYRSKAQAEEKPEYNQKADEMQSQIDYWQSKVNEYTVTAMRNYREKKVETPTVTMPKIKVETPEEPDFDEWRTKFDVEHAMLQKSAQERADYYKSIYEDDTQSYADRQAAYRNYVSAMEQVAQEEMDKYVKLKPDIPAPEPNFDDLRKAVDEEFRLINSSLDEQIQYFEDIYKNEQLSYEERLDAYQKYLEKKQELANHEKSITDMQVNITKGMLSSFGSIMNSLADLTEDEAQQLRIKAIATVAQAIASIIQGYATASAQVAAGAGPIAWAAFSLSGLAQITAVIAQVKQLAQYAGGGIVDGRTTIGDFNLARVNKGEMILNGSQQQRLFNMLNGPDAKAPNNEKSEVVFRLSGSELIGVINNYERTHRIR